MENRINPYWEMSAGELQKMVDALENILNNQFIQMLMPVYHFYEFKTLGIMPEGMNEDLIIKECMTQRKIWDTIYDDWNQKDLSLSDSFLNYFYSHLNTQFKKVETPPIKYLTQEDVMAMSLEETNQFLAPKYYVPSEIEIVYRQFVYSFEEPLWDIIMSFFTFFEKTMDEAGFVEFSKCYSSIFAENIIYKHKDFLEILENVNKPRRILECLTDTNWFHRVYVDGLSDSHAGDCTAFACSCMRCHAEEMFKVPDTAIWNKAVGSALIHRNMNLRNSLKTIDK